MGIEVDGDFSERTGCSSRILAVVVSPRVTDTLCEPDAWMDMRWLLCGRDTLHTVVSREQQHFLSVASIRPPRHQFII